MTLILEMFDVKKKKKIKIFAIFHRLTYVVYKQPPRGVPRKKCSENMPFAKIIWSLFNIKPFAKIVSCFQ